MRIPPAPPASSAAAPSPPAPPPPPFAAAPPQLPPLRRPPSAAAAPDDSTAGLRVRGRRVQMCRAALSSTATGSARSPTPTHAGGEGGSPWAWTLAALRAGRRKVRVGRKGGGEGELASQGAIAVSLAKDAGASGGA